MAEPLQNPAKSPPRKSARWFVLGGSIGACIGIGSFTAHYARATSYLSDDPKACMNCHIMNDQYDGWSKGPHHARATCNDCHVPHDTLFNKYMVKAEHGYRHSKGFTLQDFHEPIQITPDSLKAVNDNCIRCHESMTHEIRLTSGSARADGIDCTHCHARVAHGPTR